MQPGSCLRPIMVQLVPLVSFNSQWSKRDFCREHFCSPKPCVPLCSLTSRKGYSADVPHTGAWGVHLSKVTRDKSGPVNTSFRATTYSFKIADVKISWKLSSKCYKAIYSILADKLENSNLYDGKRAGGSAMGGEWFVDSRDCDTRCDRQLVLTARKGLVCSTELWAS